MPLISLLLPTRKRPEWAKLAIRTACENANNLTSFDILCAFDDDDLTSRESVDQFARETGWPIRTFVYSRFGYTGLNHYYNNLCKETDAQLLWLFNDDFVMNSPGWDSHLTELLKNAKDSYFIVEPSNASGCNIGPLISSSLVELLGYFSPHCMNDAYWDALAKNCDSIVRLPEVNFYHYRDEAMSNPASHDTNSVMVSCIDSWRDFLVGPEFKSDLDKLRLKLSEIRTDPWIKTWNSSRLETYIHQGYPSEQLKMMITQALDSTVEKGSAPILEEKIFYKNQSTIGGHEKIPEKILRNPRDLGGRRRLRPFFSKQPTQKTKR